MQKFIKAAATILIIAACIQGRSAEVFPQDTRGEAIARQQAEKAAKPPADDTTRAERIFLAVKKELIDTPSGLYPLLGSVYPGGGLALGGGYRHYVGDRTFLDVKALWSIRNYKSGEVSAVSPGHLKGRLGFAANAGWLDATQVAFFGIGQATSEDDRTNFRLQQFRGGAAVTARPVSVVVFGAGAAYEDYTLRKGLGKKESIEQRFTPATAPGLGVSPAYVHSTASAGIDWRPSPGYARRGGLYEVRYHDYRDRDQVYSFDRAEAEVVQHVPILRETWVLSFRGLANTTLSGAVPYFLLPALGGTNLRGYGTWRFRDRNSMLVQGEFRWAPNRLGFDMALFYDAGKVTSRRAELNFKGLKKDVGVEARFHGPAATPLRLGVACGSEGCQVVFGGSASF